jgi:hypothetical protein
MPIALKRLHTGRAVLVTRCEVEGCQAPAVLGRNVHYRMAMRALEAGDKATAKRLFGTWHCADHAASASEAV